MIDETNRNTKITVLELRFSVTRFSKFSVNGILGSFQLVKRWNIFCNI